MRETKFFWIAFLFLFAFLSLEAVYAGTDFELGVGPSAQTEAANSSPQVKPGFVLRTELHDDLDGSGHAYGKAFVSYNGGDLTGTCSVGAAGSTLVPDQIKPSQPNQFSVEEQQKQSEIIAKRQWLIEAGSSGTMTPKHFTLNVLEAGFRRKNPTGYLSVLASPLGFNLSRENEAHGNLSGAKARLVRKLPFNIEAEASLEASILWGMENAKTHLVKQDGLGTRLAAALGLKAPLSEHVSVNAYAIAEGQFYKLVSTESEDGLSRVVEKPVQTVNVNAGALLNVVFDEMETE